MANNKAYIERVRLAVEKMHGCKAVHVRSVPVHEVFRGETAWRGLVEVFVLSGHKKANRAYGWSYGEPEQFIALLEIPPVESPETAVKVAVAYLAKQAGK